MALVTAYTNNFFGWVKKEVGGIESKVKIKRVFTLSDRIDEEITPWILDIRHSRSRDKVL